MSNGMSSDTLIPPSNVVRFPRPLRTHCAADGRPAPAAGYTESRDEGPSTEESLRLMRAFTRIKNRHLRADLITMLEGASRRRGPLPAHGKE
jgi:hypothetical protein